MVNFENVHVRDLRKCLDALVPGMADKDWYELLSIGELVSLKKGDVLYPAGYRHNSVGFLLKGAMRSFEEIDARNITFNFYLEHDVVVDYESLHTGVGSAATFVTQESSLLLRFDYRQLSSLLQVSPYWCKLYQQLAELQCKKEFDCRRFLLRMDATERYDFLLKNKPCYFKRFAQKDLASYMGVTPTSFSRLRKTYKHGEFHI